MQTIFSLTTVAAFWLHSLLGCCAHHAHGVDMFATGGRISSDSSADPDHSHCHDHSGPDSNTPHLPGVPDDDCHELLCTFLTTGKTTLDLDSTVATLPGVALDAEVALASLARTTWSCDAGAHLRLPMRLHLFHQILLI